MRLIGDYDDNIDKGVTDLQQRSEQYFTKLRSDGNVPYDQGFYDDIHIRLSVLKSRAASLPKYKIIATQLNNLNDQFGKFQKLDQITTRPIHADTVDTADSAITVSVESILTLELALKRGDIPASK